MQATNVQTTQPNGTAGSVSRTKVPFVLRERVLVNRASTPAEPTPMHLEEVRDYLRVMTRLQKPDDIERSLDQLHVDFEGGVMKARWLTRNGTSKDVLIFTSNGAGQVSKEVLPSSFFNGLKQLAWMDADGEKVAAMAWLKFAQKQDRIRMVRTINVRIGSEVFKAIRSCHSQSYAPYSNLEFVQSLLDSSTDFAERPVLDWRVTDSAMRLRFAGIDAPLAALRHWDPSGMLEEPIPMIECWNSEVGRRRVGLRGGMWKLISGSGMGHWGRIENKTEANWIHRGDSDRIRSGVSSVYQNILVAANGVVDSYKKALSVSIDDAYDWMRQEMKRSNASDRVIEAAREGLDDVTTTSGGCLASVVDAITLVAQKESIFDQYDLEHMASTILRRGLAEEAKLGYGLPLIAKV